MLGDKDAVVTLAIKDLEAARKFYEGTLGLKQIDADGNEVIVYASGNSRDLGEVRKSPAVRRPTCHEEVL